MNLIKYAATAAAVSLLVGGSLQAATLDDVKSAGELKCGISTGVPGFAFTNDAGDWQGFDPAVCQAVAAAVLGDTSKVKYTTTTCLLYTSPSPRDGLLSRMPSSA